MQCMWSGFSLVLFLAKKQCTPKLGTDVLRAKKENHTTDTSIGFSSEEGAHIQQLSKYRSNTMGNR